MFRQGGCFKHKDYQGFDLVFALNVTTINGSIGVLL